MKFEKYDTVIAITDCLIISKGKEYKVQALDGEHRIILSGTSYHNSNFKLKAEGREMNNKEMKKLYESGEYIALSRWKESNHNHKGSTEMFNINEFPDFEDNTGYYKLIHIKHKEILDAVLADSSVEVEVYLEREEIWQSLDTDNEYNTDFISSYVAECKYQLKPKGLTDLNNCYCEATQEHYDNLKDKAMFVSTYDKKYKYYVIENTHEISLFNYLPACAKKQIHIVNNQWEYKHKDAQEVIKNTNYKQIKEMHDSLEEKQTLSIVDGDKTLEFEFKKGIELVKVFGDSILCVVEEEGKKAFWIDKKTGYYGRDPEGFYNLTPIKKLKFPSMYIDKKNLKLYVCHDMYCYESAYHHEKFRLATDEEINSLKTKDQ